jgi:tripartite-type tricarboxylate transporter receptor subunit TctC
MSADPTRRRVLRAAAALAVPLTDPRASLAADPFPSRPVRIVVPVAPGGSADKLTRTIAQKLSAAWPHAAIVENVPGASGNIGTARVAKSAPDGHTLAMTSEGLLLNALIAPAEMGYDGPRAFTGVTKAVVTPQVLAVRAEGGARTLGEYLERARREPGASTVGLPVRGGIGHVAHEMLAQETGTRFNYVPYPGGAPAVTDVVAGHVGATMVTLAAVTELVRAGRLRALAVTTSYRSPALPDVPTVAEAAGLAGYSVESWQGFVLPAATPRPIVERLGTDFRAALAQADVIASLESLGFKVVASTPAELDVQLREDLLRYERVVRQAGMAQR